MYVAKPRYLRGSFLPGQGCQVATTVQGGPATFFWPMTNSFSPTTQESLFPRWRASQGSHNPWPQRRWRLHRRRVHRVRLEFSGAASLPPAGEDVGGITCQRDWHGGQEHLVGRDGWKSLSLRRKKVWFSGQFRCLTLSLEENCHQARSRAPNRCGCWYQPSTLAGQGSGGGLSARSLVARCRLFFRSGASPDYSQQLKGCPFP